MVADKITAEQILGAILAADSEKHPSQQAYFIGDNLTDTLIDGRVNLVRVAELLSDVLNNSR